MKLRRVLRLCGTENAQLKEECCTFYTLAAYRFQHRTRVRTQLRIQAFRMRTRMLYKNSKYLPNSERHIHHDLIPNLCLCYTGSVVGITSTRSATPMMEESRFVPGQAPNPRGFLNSGRLLSASSQAYVSYLFYAFPKEESIQCLALSHPMSGAFLRQSIPAQESAIQGYRLLNLSTWTTNRTTNCPCAERHLRAGINVWRETEIART